MFNKIKLFNFFKVYPLSLLSSILFFGMLALFATKVSSTIQGAGLLIGALILFVLFVSTISFFSCLWGNILRKCELLNYSKFITIFKI